MGPDRATLQVGLALWQLDGRQQRRSLEVRHTQLHSARRVADERGAVRRTLGGVVARREQRTFQFHQQAEAFRRRDTCVVVLQDRACPGEEWNRLLLAAKLRGKELAV